MVNEWDNHVAIEQKPLAGIGVGHIAKLVRGDIELLCQDLTVAARLVQHINKIAVFQDIFDLAGGKQVVG